MNLYSIIFGENDSFLRGRQGEVEPVETQNSTKENIIPIKFRDDVDALTAYIGAERFKKGLSIEVKLSELLEIVPRQRRRIDAYNSLVKYLNEELGISLTIKSQKQKSNGTTN